MTCKDFVTLFEYNRWANDCVLTAAAKLHDEQFTRNLSSSFSSVRDTLVHIMGAEWVWLQRWQGISPGALLAPSEFADFAALRARWTDLMREQMEFINHLTEAALEQEISYINFKGQNWRYPLARMLQHVVNHSTYHRGQVATMLRQLGAAPVSTDFLLFFDQAR